MPIYMKIEGIDGDVTTFGYEKWIEIDSLQWGASHLFDRFGGGGEGKTNMSELVVTGQFLRGAAKMFYYCVSGRITSIPVEIAAVVLGDKVQEYYRYRLSDVLVSSYNLSQSGGEQGPASTSFSLNFTKIEYFVGIPNQKGQTTKQGAFFDIELGTSGLL